MTQATDKLRAGLARLPAGDKFLLQAMIAASLLVLGLGLVMGLFTALARGGYIQLHPEIGYRLMTLHGVAVFFYWFYIVQAAILLALLAVWGEGYIAQRTLALGGFVLMLAGLAANLWASLAGTPLLYNGTPELATEADRPMAALFYAGYLALAFGLVLISVSAIATALLPKKLGKVDNWPTVSFAAISWAGLVLVSAIAVVHAFVPVLLWALGLRGEVAHFGTYWHLLFHNMHYLPLMGTVLIWYVLAESLTGVASIFGARFSKIVFSTYMIFVPPTSLYHMFLDPNLAEPVRVIGSLLSLFVGVPTATVFLIIVASLEAHARAQGARGLFGWIGRLPWGDPAMSAMGFSVVNLALGGIFSFVLIQGELAPLLSDTFFVPGYFHFLTLGTVTLTLLAALVRMLPALSGRRLPLEGMVAKLPWLMTLGLILFGYAGIKAGLSGLPRRLLDSSYEGAAPADWPQLMGLMGAGAMAMALALAVYVLALLANLIAARGESGRSIALAADMGTVSRQSAWVGPLAILVLMLGMYGATAVAFDLMRSLPIEFTASGGHAH